MFMKVTIEVLSAYIWSLV